MAQWLVFHLFFLLLLLSFILPLLSHFTSLILLFLSPCFPALPSLAFHPFRAAPPSSLSKSFQAFSSFQYVFLSFSPSPPPPHTLFLSNISFSGFSSCFSFSPAFALPLCLPPLGPAVLPEALCWIWGFSAAEAMKEAAFGWKLTEHARNQQMLLGCWGVENVNMLWLQSHCLSPHVGQTTCAGCPNTYALQQLLSVIIDFCSFLCSKVFSLFAKLWFVEGSEHAQSMQDLLEVAPTIFMPAQQTEAPPSF